MSKEQEEEVMRAFRDAQQKPNGSGNGAGDREQEQGQQDAGAIEGRAGTIPEPATKPTLVIFQHDHPLTAEAVRDLLAASPELQIFNRGGPVYIPKCGAGEVPEVARLSASGVIRKVHELRQPAIAKGDGGLHEVTLPERIARMYLEMDGEHNLRPLTGICTSPILAVDGDIRVADGYDDATGQWCSNVPDIKIEDKPTREDAENALRVLRDAFKTFPFADAVRKWDESLRADVVDLSKDPKLDEAAFLAGLLTAVCRQSLRYAPGLALLAAMISGAGCGKGLMTRCISAVAYGMAPSAVPRGDSIQELDKRIVAELIKGHPVLFLDNINGARLESATLASIMTERPVRLRQLGESKMIELDSAVFVIVTGNGLTISEDLVRRFLVCELDARVEDPEQREFAPGFLESIKKRRAELLGACLTIWRWGQQATDIKAGKALGGFEDWRQWVRDPLFTLGCADPVDRLRDIKARDPKRRHVTEIFTTWFDYHKSSPVKAFDLADEVVAKISGGNPMSRQKVAAEVGKLEGTRAGGFVLTSERRDGKRSVTEYRLLQTAPAHGQESMRGHAVEPPPAEKTGGKTGSYTGAISLYASPSMQGPYGGMQTHGPGMPPHVQRMPEHHAEHPGQKNGGESNRLDGKTASPRMTPHAFDAVGQGGANPDDDNRPFDIGPPKCAQCQGTPDGKEVAYDFKGATIYLHPQCKRFWEIQQ
jgi:hypothetical protein